MMGEKQQPPASATRFVREVIALPQFEGGSDLRCCPAVVPEGVVSVDWLDPKRTRAQAAGAGDERTHAQAVAVGDERNGDNRNSRASGSGNNGDVSASRSDGGGSGGGSSSIQGCSSALAPIVVLVPGLTGSSSSGYVASFCVVYAFLSCPCASVPYVVLEIHRIC
jgi:hypothetical protein